MDYFLRKKEDKILPVGGNEVVLTDYKN